jgi:CRISPR-associated protein Csx10
MKIKMKLISDTVFGNGESIPGGEDIAVLTDENGFPYYKGTTFKGVFREEYTRLLKWKCKGNDVDDESIEKKANKLFGIEGSDDSDEEKIIFSDFGFSENVKEIMLNEIGKGNSQEILDSVTNIRTFTSVSDDGIVKEGSLRQCRCVNKGLCFFSEIICPENVDEDEIVETLSMIKWIGSMRNRGFGKVEISKCD